MGNSAKLVAMLFGVSTNFRSHYCKITPSKDQLYSWKADINNNRGMTRQYIEAYAKRLDVDCIDVLLRLHTAKNTQAVVQQEVNWFSKSYNKPQGVTQHPPASLIANFQKMLYFN